MSADNGGQFVITDMVQIRAHEAYLNGDSLAGFVRSIPLEATRVGIPQYRVQYPRVPVEHGILSQDVFPVEEITVVPGPMIHPVIPNKAVLPDEWDYED